MTLHPKIISNQKVYHKEQIKQHELMSLPRQSLNYTFDEPTIFGSPNGPLFIETKVSPNRNIYDKHFSKPYQGSLTALNKYQHFISPKSKNIKLKDNLSINNLGTDFHIPKKVHFENQIGLPKGIVGLILNPHLINIISLKSFNIQI